jgi:DnaD/phage-associated family protein
MQGFNGFPDGRLKTIALPALFFSELLPIIDNLAELRVTLYTFWALHQKEGTIRYLCRRDFTADDILMDSLGRPRRAAEAVLEDALEHAIARGTLLHISVEGATGLEDLYFMNTGRGRAAVEGIIRGEWRPTGDPEEPVSLTVERPNVFVLYEQNIGPLTPIIAEHLQDAEETYPAAWIEEAIEIAVDNNARKWSYISRILERWKAEGKHDATSGGDSTQDRRRYIEGKYGDLIQR